MQHWLSGPTWAGCYKITSTRAPVVQSTCTFWVRAAALVAQLTGGIKTSGASSVVSVLLEVCKRQPNLWQPSCGHAFFERRQQP